MSAFRHFEKTLHFITRISDKCLLRGALARRAWLRPFKSRETPVTRLGAQARLAVDTCHCFDDERAIALHVAFKNAQIVCPHHKSSNFISDSVSAEAESRDSDAKSVGQHGINASKCAIAAGSFCSCDSMRSEMRHFKGIDAEHTDADSVIGCICIDARVRCA